MYWFCYKSQCLLKTEVNTTPPPHPFLLFFFTRTKMSVPASELLKMMPILRLCWGRRTALAQRRSLATANYDANAAV